MSYSIRHSIGAPMAYCGSNFLSPVPCVLSPLIHASRLTSANHRPVDNTNAPAAHHRLGWMGFAEIGGGW